MCDTALAVRKFQAYESSRMQEYEIFTRTKISVIAVHRLWTPKRRRPTYRGPEKYFKYTS